MTGGVPVAAPGCCTAACSLRCAACQACLTAGCGARQRCCVGCALLALQRPLTPHTHTHTHAPCLPPLLLTCAQVFDAGSRTLLRQFKGGHKAPVHVAKFAADQQHVLTGGDDGLLILWDVTSGQQVGARAGQH